MSDTVLALSWLVLLHLVADFVVQTDAVAARKSLRGLAGVLGILGHVLVTAVCFAPVVAVAGEPGIAFVAVVVVSHAAIDWVKVAATRRAEARALHALEPAHAVAPGNGGLELARDRARALDASRTAATEDTSLGPAWTLRPAAYFLADQAAHVLVLVIGWRAFLAGAAPTTFATDVVARLAAGTDPLTIHRVVLMGVVGLAVVIVNVSAAALFVGLLLKPARIVGGASSAEPIDAGQAADPAVAAAPAGPASTGWRFRVGPLSGSLEPLPGAGAGPDTGRGALARRASSGSDESPGRAGAARLAPPLNVGRAIGIFERLLVAMLIVTQAEAAVALVVGVKTIARFRQLDDRAFAEYYLLGTLASVSIAVASGLVARLVLQGA